MYKIVEDIFNEIPRYRKKRASSKSKSFEKSKHKHDYEDCLLICNENPYKAKYCRVCGKIDDLKLGITEEFTMDGEKHYRKLTNKEVLERYKDLEQFEVEDVFNKFVPLVRR